MDSRDQDPDRYVLKHFPPVPENYRIYKFIFQSPAALTSDFISYKNMYGFSNLPKNLEFYFSEEQLREISQWFDEVSVWHEISGGEKSQVITVEEIVKFLSLKKYHVRNFHYPTLMEVMKEVESIKPSNQKLLTKQEFINMFSKWVKLPNIKHELNLAFSVFDTEKRNYLDIDEIQVIVTQYGDVFTDDEVRELLRDANVRGDGNVFYRNFIKSLFAVAPELWNLKIDYLFKDPTDDPSGLFKPVVVQSKSKSKKKKKSQKSKKKN